MATGRCDEAKHTVYNQWTQFEEFPRFMRGVERVEQLDDRRLHWVADFGGSTHEWDAEITDQVPDDRIAWRSLDGRPSSAEQVGDGAGITSLRSAGGSSVISTTAPSSDCSR
jgi:uncharacterized membrane protein